MSDFVVYSVRDQRFGLPDCCVYEYEDVLVSSLGADLYTASAPMPPGHRYKAAFFAGVHLGELVEALNGAVSAGLQADHWCGYVFGAHLDAAVRLSSLHYRALNAASRRLDRLDCLFVGFDHQADQIGERLKTPVHCAPIAVDLLKVEAAVEKRPIAINGFGRQDRAVSDMLSDRMNRPGSSHLFYHTNVLKSSGVTDWRRYRDMFWQVLRMSSMSLCFDQIYYNPHNQKTVSHVGPRWMESLGAGAVVVGKAPRTTDAKTLLDWEDATIELDDDPATAVDEILALLEDEARIESVSRRNLERMHAKHDWRFRICDMLETLGAAKPETMTAQLAELERRRSRFVEPCTNLPNAQTG